MESHHNVELVFGYLTQSISSTANAFLINRTDAQLIKNSTFHVYYC